MKLAIQGIIMKRTNNLKYLGVFILFLFAIDGSACKCAMRSLEESIETTKFIFVGKIISREGKTYTVDPYKVWKGDIPLDVPHEFVQGSTNCEKMWLEPSKEYIFFTDGRSVSICSRTTESYFSADIEELDNIFSDELQIVPGDVKRLKAIQYERKNIIYTEQGKIDIKDKTVVFLTCEQHLLFFKRFRSISRDKLREGYSKVDHAVYLVAKDYGATDCEFDYIFRVDRSYSSQPCTLQDSEKIKSKVARWCRKR